MKLSNVSSQITKENQIIKRALFNPRDLIEAKVAIHRCEVLIKPKNRVYRVCSDERPENAFASMRVSELLDSDLVRHQRLLM